MIDSIIDLYHLNTVNLALARADGVVAVIHKATEGVTVKDAEYSARRDQAKSLGLLWGAYHYASGASVSDQVANFLDQAQPTDDDVVALDWESSTSGPDMTVVQARRFATMIRSELGRWPVIYGGRLLRESIGAGRDEVLANCPLWYSRYASAPIGIPTATWPTFTLWQFTDGNSGPLPHSVNGVGRCDHSRFPGTLDELKAQWPFVRRDDGTSVGPGAQLLMRTTDASAKPKAKAVAKTRSRKRPRR